MQTLVAEILAAWRRSERLVDGLPAGSAEHEAAVQARDRLRDLYRDLTAAGMPAVSEADARQLLAELADG